MAFDFKLRRAAQELINSNTVKSDPATALRLIGWIVDELGFGVPDGSRELLQDAIVAAYEDVAAQKAA